MTGLSTGNVIIRRETNSEMRTIKNPPTMKDVASGVDAKGYAYVENKWLLDAIRIRIYEMEMVYENEQDATTTHFTNKDKLPRND